MALEIGGRADKDGNEFERLWVAFLALEVVEGRAQSIQWEPPTEQAEGGELVLVRDGRSELHQCKLGNASKGRWTVAELQSNGVLANAEGWLAGDDAREFHFVSRHPAAALEGLAQRAERTHRDHLGDLSVADHRELAHLAKALGRDLAVDAEKARVIDRLRRLRFSTGFWGADRRRLESLAESAFVGRGADIIGCLTFYLYQRLGRPVHADELRHELADAGFTPRDPRHDARTPAAVARLQDQLLSDLGRTLIADSLIRRDCSQRILKRILADPPAGVILVAGGAGSGKSGVLLEVCRELRERHIPFLPLRLDLERPDCDLMVFSTDKLGLPADPLACLEAVADRRPSILVIDQLDAIRWTAAHAEKALQVVGELLERAKWVKKLTVVVACRTFDLEDDKRLRGLFGERTERVEVGDLPDPEVAAVVKDHGVNPQHLPPKELQLLRNAFTLALWVEIARRSEPPMQFASRAHLLRIFWEQQRRAVREERGLTDVDVNTLLDRLVAYLDRERRLDAPRILLDSYPQVAEALQSLGLLQEQGGRVRFAHQAHTDYLIAQHVVSKMVEQGMTLLQWLEGDQSLFRREQVRQVLQMLRGVEPDTYAAAIADLLGSRQIRFHLRQLAVQVLRQVDFPLPVEVEVVATALEAGELAEYLSQHLLSYSLPWTQSMLDHGLLSLWLRSTDPKRRAMALRVLGSCSQQMGEQIAATALPILHQSTDAATDIAELLPYDVTDDTPAIFEERLRLAHAHPWLAARQLCSSIESSAESAPWRALRLVHAIVAGAVKRYEAPSEEDRSVIRDLTRDNHADAIVAAFKTCAQQACQLYLPLLACIGEAATSQEGDVDRYEWYRFQRMLVDGLGAAGQEIAKTTPGAATALIERLAPSAHADRIAARTLTGLEPREHADQAMRWILADANRLVLSWNDSEYEGWLAADLLSRFAASCSDMLYQRIEDALLAVRREWEVKSVREQLALIRERPPGLDPLMFGDGSPRNWYGTVQHVLLSALPVERRSERAARRAACWRSKFGEASRAVRSEGMGGTVGSPIPGDYLDRIPDRQWLQIASGAWSRREGRNLRQVGPSELSERSHASFAADFGEATRRNPIRFSQLALRLRGDTAPDYIRSALYALVDVSQPANAAPEWAPAAAEALERLVQRAEEFAGTDPSVARAFCWAVSRRPTDTWSASTVERLARYAESALDPEPSSLAVRNSIDGKEANHLESSALNSVRGAAVYALAAPSLEDSALQERRLSALRAASRDPHCAVRIATQGAARTLLRGNAQAAMELFLAASEHQDDRVLGSSEARQFLIRTWRDHQHVLEQLFRRMIASDVPAAAQLGAECVTAAWLFDGRLEELFRLCQSGNPAQRRGVVAVAVVACSDDEPPAEAIATLMPLFGDRDVEVSNTAARVFSRARFLERASTPQVAAEYARTGAFLKDPDALIDPLAEDLAQAPRFGDAIAVVARRLGELPREKIPWDLESKLTTLILAVYERTDDHTAKEACLDAFDALLRASSPRIQKYLDRL